MIDNDKDPDADCYSMEYEGTRLSSRYGKRAEFETMMAVIDKIADEVPEVLFMIKSVFCDSKACAVYSITCCNGDDVEIIAKCFDRAFRNVAGGHNGLCAQHGTVSFEVGAWWDGD